MTFDIPNILPHYGTRYIIRDATRTGSVYEVLIKERMWIGDSERIHGQSQSPVTLNLSYADKNFFSPVAGSSCKLKLYTDTYDGFLHLGMGDDTKYRVEVYEGATMLFNGFIKPQTYSQEYGPQGPVVTVEATDGLGLLRDIPFRPEEKPTRGAFVLKDVISYLLYLAGNRKDWLDEVSYESAVSAGVAENVNTYGSFSHQIFQWFDAPCYNVLTDILTMFKAQIISIDGHYHIRLIDDPEAGYYDRYDYQGTKQSTGARTIIKKDLHTDYMGPKGRVKIDRPVRKVIVKQTMPPIENLIYNNDFEEGTDGWDPSAGLSFSVTEGVAKIRGEGEYLQQLFNRGIRRGTPVKLYIKLRVRYRGSADTWKLKISHANQMYESEEFDYRDEDGRIISGWQTIDTWYDMGFRPQEEHFYLETVYADPDIKIYAPPGGAVLDISDVQVQALQWETEEPFEEKKRRKVIVINEDNLSDEINEVEYGQGDPHVYENALNIYPLFVNRTSHRIPYFDLMRSRFVNYHSHNKVRLNLTVLNKADSDILNGAMIINDKYIGLDFLITSMSYDIRGSEYTTLELVSFRQYVPDDPMEWILAEGHWNDDGYWMDGETWNDGGGSYDIVFTATKTGGEPVTDFLVNICCPSNTKGSGDTNTVTFLNRKEGNYTYKAWKEGHTEETGTFAVSGADKSISVTLNPE